MQPLVDLDRYIASRHGLHAVAEHILCPARHAAVGRIGLRASPGGFATPYFGDQRRVLVDGTLIGDVRHEECEFRPLSTLRAAAVFLDVVPGAPGHVFTATTPCDLDAPLTIAATDAAVIAEWFSLGNAVLREWRDAKRALQPSSVQLWPEHFDLACDLGDADRGRRANYGFSPGDDGIPEPYVYVGPWAPEPRVGDFWDQAWGASLRRSQIADEVAAGRVPMAIVTEFFSAGLRELTLR